MNTDRSNKITPQQPFCFVLIPQTRAYLNLWDAVIRPAIENNGMDALRKEEVAQRYDNIMEGVRVHIIDAEVIITVVTGEDATVMYDLGLAHAAKKKVVMMLEQNKQPPANFSHGRILSYDPTDFPQGREELMQRLQSVRQTLQFDDLFPELRIRGRQDLEEYEYLKQTRKTLAIKITPKNCSIFFNNRLLGASPQMIHFNPEADRNVLSVYASTYFEHYQVLSPEDLEASVLEINMDVRDEKKYPERVNSWLMRRREDPDNPVLSRAIGRYLWKHGDLEAARQEMRFCVSKAPEWFSGYDLLGRVEAEDSNYENAKNHFQMVADLNPEDYGAWYYIARTESMAGNYPAALEALERIIVSPKLVESYRQLFCYQDSHFIKQDRDFHNLREEAPEQFQKKFATIVDQLGEIVAAPEPALIDRPSPDIQADEEPQPLPYTLKQLRMANFQCVNGSGVSKIPVDCPWIFLTGENGVGKTSLLQALTIGLYGAEDADRLLTRSNDDCKIDVEIQENGTSYLRHFYWESDHWKTVNPQDKDREALEPAQNILAYGTSRLFMLDGNRMGSQKTQISPVISLLSPGGDLYNIEYWFQMQTLQATNRDSKDFAILSRIEKVKALLVSLMPHVTDIELSGTQVRYKEKGRTVPFDHLAASHKSIVAMIGDMLYRLFESQPETTNPKELQGIVLIDELENHLHPRWQVEFPKLLSETFPKVQFIASTHSVLPFLGAPKGSIFLKVTRDETEGTKVERLDIDVANLLPNALLTSPLFDLDSILPEQNENFASVHTDDDYKEILRQKEREEQLRQFLDEGTQVPKEFLEQNGDDS